MFGLKPKSKRSGGSGSRRVRAERRRRLPQGFNPWIVAAVVIGVLILTSSAVWGTRKLEAYVRARPEFQSPPRIVLTDVPDGLTDRIMDIVSSAAAGPWIDDAICQRIAEALSQSAWVERVNSVRRFADGRVAVSCEYRSATALVQSGGGFYLIDDRGVRLPGRYQYHPAFVVIQGVVAAVPAPGTAWPGADVRAALAILDRLRDEPFFDQIGGVLVENYGGRQDKRQAPIELVTTPPPAGRLIWGSAPGEEIEENTVEQKIRLLGEIYRQWGRIDAGHDIIDISTFPDRFAVRTPGGEPL